MMNTGNCVSKDLMAFLARKEGNSMAYQLQLVLLDSKKLSLEIAKSNSSVTAFSKKCGVHRQTIAEIINRGVSCRFLTAYKIAKGLNLEVEDLVLKEG